MDSGRRIPQTWDVWVSLPAGFLNTASCTFLMTCSLYAAVKFMMAIANLFLLTQVITRPLLVPVSKNKRSLVSKSLPMHSLNYILEKPEWSFECAKAVTTLIFNDHLQVMHQTKKFCKCKMCLCKLCCQCISGLGFIQDIWFWADRPSESSKASLVVSCDLEWKIFWSRKNVYDAIPTSSSKHWVWHSVPSRYSLDICVVGGTGVRVCISQPLHSLIKVTPRTRLSWHILKLLLCGVVVIDGLCCAFNSCLWIGKMSFGSLLGFKRNSFTMTMQQ